MNENAARLENPLGQYYKYLLGISLWENGLSFEN